MPVTEAEVIEALRPVEDPELHRSIVDLGMVKEIVIAGGAVLALSACNTIKGMGQDIQKAGEKIEGAARK